MKRYLLFVAMVGIVSLAGYVQSADALISNPDANPWDQYGHTEIVYEGELCGDADQNAKLGGTYYECDTGLSCDLFEPDGNKVQEPYGRCVVNEKYMCEATTATAGSATGGEIYDDMSCNCPLSSNGGCDGDLIRVTQESTYDENRNELNIEISAKNTSNDEVVWSENRKGCKYTEDDIFGVRVK